MTMTSVLSLEREKMPQSHMYKAARLASPHCVCVSMLCPYHCMRSCRRAHTRVSRLWGCAIQAAQQQMWQASIKNVSLALKQQAAKHKNSSGSGETGVSIDLIGLQALFLHWSVSRDTLSVHTVFSGLWLLALGIIFGQLSSCLISITLIQA